MFGDLYSCRKVNYSALLSRWRGFLEGGASCFDDATCSGASALGAFAFKHPLSSQRVQEPVRVHRQAPLSTKGPSGQTSYRRHGALDRRLTCLGEEPVPG